MTTYRQEQGFIPNDTHAPVLDIDRAEASRLWDQVKGTDLEQAYREVSARHPNKADSRAHYLAFLGEIEQLFVQPDSGLDAAPLWDEPVVQASPQPPVAAELPQAPDPEVQAQAEPQAQPAEGQDDGGTDDGGADNGDGDDDGADEDGDATPAPPPAAPAPADLSASAPTGVQGTGLFSELFGMLHDGGEMTVQVMRVGQQLTVGLFPSAMPGEAQPQGVVVTQAAAWFDANLLTAMRPYSQARVEAFSVFQEAAQRQQQSAKKAAEKPAASKPAANAKNKTYTLTLQAAEGSTVTGKQEGKAVELKLGDNEVKQGNLEITVKHELYGEQQKTLAVFQNRGHDLREQQGGMVTVQVKPETAALSATMGETVMSLHGETLLPPGKWVIQAEAHSHKPKAVTVTVKAGKPQTVEFELEEDMTLF